MVVMALGVDLIKILHCVVLVTEGVQTEKHCVI
jgi:hypothetical protein